MSAALRSVGFLDVLSSTPAEYSRRAPCSHARLRRLATKSGEKRGLGACPSIRRYRAHGACEIWDRTAAQREVKARGRGDAGTSSTTSNDEIASHPPCALGVSARRGHLPRWRSSTMTPYRLRRAALHLPPPSQKRDTS